MNYISVTSSEAYGGRREMFRVCDIVSMSEGAEGIAVLYIGNSLTGKSESIISLKESYSDVIALIEQSGTTVSQLPFQPPHHNETTPHN